MEETEGQLRSAAQWRVARGIWEHRARWSGWSKESECCGGGELRGRSTRRLRAWVCKDADWSEQPAMQPEDSQPASLLLCWPVREARGPSAGSFSRSITKSRISDESLACAHVTWRHE